MAIFEILVLCLAILGALSAGFFICLFITCLIIIQRNNRNEKSEYRHRDKVYRKPE